MSLRMKLVKQSQQDIKHRHRSGKPRRNVGSSSFEDVLEMGNQGQHGKAGFNQHSLIPSTFGTDFDVLWNAIDIACPADRKSTRLNSSHQLISYAVFCLKKK